MTDKKAEAPAAGAKKTKNIELQVIDRCQRLLEGLSAEGRGRAMRYLVSLYGHEGPPAMREAAPLLSQEGLEELRIMMLSHDTTEAPPDRPQGTGICKHPGFSPGA